jgi:4-carboxymuconolactone decarboxylase
MRAVVARTFNGVAQSEMGARQRTAYDLLHGRIFSLDYTELLRRLSLHDERVMAAFLGGACSRSSVPDPILDARTLALVRLAALVAVGGAVLSYGAQADAAIDAGATVAEIVDVLVAVIPVVGVPRVVAAAPRLAVALGHDVDDAFGILPGE